MKRAILLLLALALSLAACGGGDDEGPQGSGSTSAEELRVGLVTDIGQLNDRGFNQLAFEGLRRA
ncbi:MAG: BMP family ABC transporter substrate-binding protein, partial [Thermoleophilia bacterium]|nr:BMP family ABC transporter substrate-binding protein [Thermoleophilia bacterium]